MQFVVDFSNLDQDSKRKYFDFLLENKVNLKPTSQNDFVAQIRIDRPRLKSQNNLKRDFTPAKDKRVARNPSQSPKHVPTQQPQQQVPHSVNKFGDLEINYPSIMSEIKYKDQLSRPLKLKGGTFKYFTIQMISFESQRKSTANECHLNHLTDRQISRRFAFSSCGRSTPTSNKSPKQSVPLIIEHMIINFLGTVDLLSPKNREVSLFKEFLQQKLTTQTLQYFLALRQVIQKSIKKDFYHPLQKQAPDLTRLLLTHKQINEIVDIVSQDSTQRTELLGSLRFMEQVSVTDLCYLAVQKYSADYHFNTRRMKKNATPPPQQYQQQPQNFYDSPDNPYEDILQRVQLQAGNTQPPDLFEPQPKQLQQQFQQPSIIPLLALNQPASQYSNAPSNQHISSIQHVQSIEETINHIQKQKRDPVSSSRFELSKLRNLSFNTPLQNLIIEKLEEQISNFVESMLIEMEDIKEAQKVKCRLKVEDKIQDVVVCLLDSIYKFDKMIWFKKLNNLQPDSQSLVYIESLQKQYRQLSKSKSLENQQVETLCAMIMKTPELAKMIGNALFQFFENL